MGCLYSKNIPSIWNLDGYLDHAVDMDKVTNYKIIKRYNFYSHRYLYRIMLFDQKGAGLGSTSWMDKRESDALVDKLLTSFNLKKNNVKPNKIPFKDYDVSKQIYESILKQGSPVINNEAIESKIRSDIERKIRPEVEKQVRDKLIEKLTPKIRQELEEELKKEVKKEVKSKTDPFYTIYQ